MREFEVTKWCSASDYKRSVFTCTSTSTSPFPPTLLSLSSSSSPPHTRESSDTFVMEERGSEEEFSLVYVCVCVSSSILLVLTLLAEQLIFQYSNIKIQVHTVFTIRFFHTRYFVDFIYRRRGKIRKVNGIKILILE